MVVMIDTETLPPRDRNEAVMALLSEATNPIVVSHDLPDELTRNLTRCWRIGSRNFLIRMRDTNIRFSRASTAIRRDDRELYAVSFQHHGRGHSLREDRTVLQRPGTLTLENVTQMRGFAYDGTADNQSFMIAHDDIGLPVPLVLTAAKRINSSPLYRLVQAHLARLSTVADELPVDSVATELVATTGVQLVRALVASTSLENQAARTAIHDTLSATVMTCVREHLGDPRLTLQAIAAANHISPRMLHKLWSENGESVSDWILRERLEGARNDLMTPESLLVTIEVVPRRWGLIDPSHFSRRFRETYGSSPREWKMMERG